MEKSDNHNLKLIPS